MPRDNTAPKADPPAPLSPVSPARVWRNRAAVAAAVFSALSLGSLAWLRELPYSTSELVPMSGATIDRAPGDEFTMGPLTWEMAAYREDPALAPFRTWFTATCPGQLGLPAARCLAHALHVAFPQDNPAMEWTDTDYSPAADLALHLAGAPGHCMTRAGLSATALLSVGIPARVAQLLPADTPGHTVFSVWDAEGGWIMVDPTFEGVLEIQGKPVSLHAALAAPWRVRWVGEAEAAVDAEPLFAKNSDLLLGQAVYPEPWLYTRSGSRGSSWPFHGLYGYFGPPQWSVGPGQAVTRWATVIFGVLAIASALFAAVRAIPTRRASV